MLPRCRQILFSLRSRTPRTPCPRSAGCRPGCRRMAGQAQPEATQHHQQMEVWGAGFLQLHTVRLWLEQQHLLDTGMDC
jgi:hypothetical protein